MTVAISKGLVENFSIHIHSCAYFFLGPRFGVRHTQTFLLFYAIAVEYYGRSSIGMSLVAMTHAATTNPNFPEFPWGQMEKSIILICFLVGYTSTQAPGGYFSHRFGAKRMALIAIIGFSAIQVISPVIVTEIGMVAFCIARFVQGLFQGLLFPAVHGHLAKWTPKDERTLLGALSHTGLDFGNVLAMGATGLIASSDFGWPGISYFGAIFGFGWFVLFLIWGEESPETSKRITSEEKYYIISSQKEGGQETEKLKTPYKAMFKSLPFWAFFFGKCSETWGYSIQLEQVPTYMHSVLGFDIKSNALFSSLPYVGTWILSYIYIIIVMYLLKRNVSLTWIRKFFASWASFIPAACFIAVGFLRPDQTNAAIGLLILSGCVQSAAVIGMLLNTLDLAPNFSDVVMGTANGPANLINIFNPLIVALVVTDEVCSFFGLFLETNFIYFIFSVQSSSMECNLLYHSWSLHYW